jgi:hypothetical protein
MKKVLLFLTVFFVACSHAPFLIYDGAVEQISYKIYKYGKNEYEVILNGCGRIPDMEYNDTLLQMTKLPFIAFLENESKFNKSSIWIRIGDSITYIGKNSLRSDKLDMSVDIGKSVTDIADDAIDLSSSVYLNNGGYLKLYQYGIYNNDYTKLFHINIILGDTLKLKGTTRKINSGVFWYSSKKYNSLYTQIGEKTFRNDISETGRYYLLVDSAFLKRYTIKGNRVRKNPDYGRIILSQTLEDALFTLNDGGCLYQVRAINSIHDKYGVYADEVELVYMLYDFN